MKTIKSMLAIASAFVVTLFGATNTNAADMANVVTDGIGVFNRILVEQAIAVEYVKGDVVKIEYEYENAKNTSFVWEVKGSTLHLYRLADEKKVFGVKVNVTNSKGGIRVRVTAPYDLEMIDVCGASSFKTAAAFTTKNINILLSGASHFDGTGDIKADKATISISGVSHVNCGLVQARTMRLEASGASRIKSNAIVEEANISISGASNADLDGKASLARVDVSGASKLHLVGNIGEMNGSASGASRIKVEGALERNKVNCSGASSVSVN